MRDLNDAAFWTARVDISIRVFDLMTLHGMTCLALRHPSLSHMLRGVGERLALKMAAMLIDTGALTTLEAYTAHEVEEDWRTKQKAYPGNGASGHAEFDGRVVAVAVDADKDKVILSFSDHVPWVGLTAEEAVHVGQALCAYAQSIKTSDEPKCKS